MSILSIKIYQFNKNKFSHKDSLPTGGVQIQAVKNVALYNRTWKACADL